MINREKAALAKEEVEISQPPASSSIEADLEKVGGVSLPTACFSRGGKA